MAGLVKTTEDIAKMRAVGKLAAETLALAASKVRAGMTTNEINSIVHEHTVDVQGAVPAPLNYHGFPKSVCTSLNDTVCHGIPDDTVIKDGDILNIDVTTQKDGYYGDTSLMVVVGGKTSPLAHQLVDVAREAMICGIEQVKPGAHLGDIGHAIQTYVEEHGFSVVRDYCGHGIGTDFHEEPQVLHYGTPGYGMKLVPGMIFTIEPMVNAGKYHTEVLEDDWTVKTVDGSLSAQWEHTVLVTDDGCEVLTLRDGEEL